MGNGFKEKSFLKKDQKKFEDGWDRIFKKTEDKKKEEKEEPSKDKENEKKS